MKKLLAGLAIAFLLFIAGIAIFLATLDVNQYRSSIAEALAKQTGRKVELGGPINLGFSWQGVTVTIRDAGIGNPVWASRPMMAGIGRFDLGVALLPLLQRQLVITNLGITNADIDLETDKNGRHNWEMNTTEQPNASSENGKTEAASSEPVSIQVEKIAISDSQLTFHDKEGKAIIFKASRMTLGHEGAGMALHFSGETDNTPVTLSINTGVKDIFSPSGSWPFEINLDYANLKLTATGTADLDKKSAAAKSYAITAGQSKMQGELTANWEGPRPFLQGTLISDHLNPADFGSPGEKTAKPARAAEEGGDEPKQLFSDKPLGLDSLKSADADFDITIGELAVGNGLLKQTTAKLTLRDGLLSMKPLNAMLGNGAVEGQVTLSAAVSPPQFAVVLNAPDIRLEDLLKILNAPAFLSGNASATINLAASGDSPHALAASAVGVIDVTAAGGSVSSSAAGDIASGLMELFSPGSSGNLNLNCMAARFIIKNGVAHDNGILADTEASTVVGNGGFDLGHEVIGIVLHARSKQMDVGGLMPPLTVSGRFADPHFRIDPSETVQKVVGVLSGGSLDSNVPEIIAQSGQNSCVYTLDHPSSETTSKSVLQGTLMGKVNSGVSNIGKALKGFLGQ